MRIIKWLSGFLYPLSFWVILSLLFGLATIICGIGLMGTSAYLIARAALMPSIAVLQIAIVGVRFFGLCRGIFRYFERLASHSVTLRLLAEIRIWFYQALDRLVPAGLQQYQSGDLLDRLLSNIDTLENFYVRVVTPPLVAIIITFCVGIFLGGFHPVLSVVLVTSLLLAGFGIPLLSQYSNRNISRFLVESRSSFNSALVDGVLGLPDILLSGQAASHFEMLDQLGKEIGKRQVKQARLTGMSTALYHFLVYLTLWVVMVISIPMVRNSQIDGVSLVVISLVTLAAFEVAAPLSQFSQNLESSIQAGKRLIELDTLPSPIVEPDGLTKAPQNYDLSVCDLSFRYSAHLPLALDCVTFNLPAGKKLAVVGPSGAGKSSLVNVLLRLWDYESGKIELGGHELKSYSMQDLRSVFSLVAQSNHVFSATVRQNLALANPSAGEQQMAESIGFVGLADWLASLPQGLDSWLGENGVKMSAGERQRLIIARTILQSAPLLICDEPTAHLDPITEKLILGNLLEFCHNKSLIWVTHRLIGLEKMDEIIVLQAGRIIERGNHALLVKNGGIYQRMWEIQNRVILGA